MPITFTIPDDALVEALARPEILEALRDLLEPDLLDTRQAMEHCSCFDIELTMRPCIAQI